MASKGIDKTKNYKLISQKVPYTNYSYHPILGLQYTTHYKVEKVRVFK